MATSTDPIIVDVYAGDLNGKPQWNLLAAAGPPWCGAILKATEGTWYAPGWFLDNWRAIHAVVPAARRGVDWFCGAYHYWRTSDNDVAQAERYLGLVEAGGGWAAEDLWPIIDLERTGNESASSQRVVDGVSAWAQWILSRTGRRPMLYGGSFIRDLGITDHMGCSLLWTARYAATLPPASYESMGWSRDRLWGWQYRGTEGSDPAPAGYPLISPMGRTDLTAMVIDDANGNAAPLAWVRPRLGSVL